MCCRRRRRCSSPASRRSRPAINFIVTDPSAAGAGLRWFRLPLFVWAIYATSIVMVLATPVLAIGAAAGLRRARLRPADLRPARGGDPVLFQHLFWFYSHPAVYIMILPAFGRDLGTGRPATPGGASSATASWSTPSCAIALVGFLVWGHHMFVSGQSLFANLVFSFLSFVVAVPSAIKVFNWTATLYRGQIRFDAPMLYALGLHRAVHDRRADRAVPGVPADRRPCHRHLFRGGAFPLHHGRRGGLGALSAGCISGGRS